MAQRTLTERMPEVRKCGGGVLWETMAKGKIAIDGRNEETGKM